jgi:hypothetical protein
MDNKEKRKAVNSWAALRRIAKGTRLTLVENVGGKGYGPRTVLGPAGRGDGGGIVLLLQDGQRSFLTKLTDSTIQATTDGFAVMRNGNVFARYTWGDA